MTRPDLNLLVTLDVLLDEGSVARAAKRLQLSPSAMSRALARLRETMGDPLLVRAGRRLVFTPRAYELREQVSRLVHDAETLLRPAQQLDLSRLSKVFTFRSSDGFAERFGPALIARVGKEAPGAQIRFVPKTDKDSTSLRNKVVDLETGVITNETGPELCSVSLFHDRFVGVVRQGHPLSATEITLQSYAAARHVFVSRRGRDRGAVDDALQVHGLERRVVTVVGGFSTALALARASDLVATVPERHTETLRVGMHSFALPIIVPELTVSLLWHPRMDADPAHRWLRNCVVEICAPQRARLRALQRDS